MPDVNNINGLLNLLPACVLVVLGNVVDFRTYKAPNQYEDTSADAQLMGLMKSIDLNAIPFNERKAMCYARGVALHTMDWIRDSCTIKHGDNVVEDLPSQYFVQVTNTLWHYKKRADNMDRTGAPHCTVTSMRRQITNLVESNANLKKMWNRRKKLPSDSFALADKDKYTIEWKWTDVMAWDTMWRDSEPGKD